MRYYTYKKAKRHGYKIVLLTNINEEYVGLAQQDEFYKIIRQKNWLIEMYNFLVCYKVKENLVPVGYSDKNEWMLQEEEHKQNISNFESNKILSICRNIKDEWGNAYWNNIYEMFNKDLEDLEDVKDAVIGNLMLYKVIKRCCQEKFPIQEYIILEVPYGDKNCWVINFVNANDFNDYHTKKLNIKIRAIDFVVEKNGLAIPHMYNRKTSKLYKAANCKSAVWI